MRAIVKENMDSLYSYKEVEIPEPGDDEVLIRVRTAGICGTDVSIIKGKRNIQMPLIPGHEFAGDVVSAGKDVRKFKPGDRVTASIVICCGECFFCKKGMESLCDNIVETGIHRNGAFAEYVAVPERAVFKIPDSMTYEEGASIDPIASAYHGIIKAEPSETSRVVVFGPGPIGLYAIQILKSIGIKEVYAVGRNSCIKRLSVAESLGAAASINIDEGNLVDKVNSVTAGEMADIVIDTSSTEDGFQDRINVLRKGGIMIALGIPHLYASISIADIVRREILIKGSLCYTRRDFQECIDLVCDRKIHVGSMISHRVSMKNFGEGLKLIEKGEAIKVMVNIGE